jgi:hypothetical protein
MSLYSLLFIVCYINVLLEIFSYQGGKVGVPLASLTPPHACVCPKPRPRFPTSYVVVPIFVHQGVKTRVDCSLC